MEIENRKEAVPFAHYLRLFRDMDPEEAAGRLPELGWDGKCFYVNLLGRVFPISWPDCCIGSPDGREPLPLFIQTFLLRYILEGKQSLATNKWKTFREMPWGEMYAKPFSGRALARAAFTFGKDLGSFRSACEELGGKPVNHGDAGYEFAFLGNYRMQIFLWEGDEEFPPSAQILYSENFARGFTAEDRVVAADILIGTIRAHM